MTAQQEGLAHDVVLPETLGVALQSHDGRRVDGPPPAQVEVHAEEVAAQDERGAPAALRGLASASQVT